MLNLIKKGWTQTSAPEKSATQDTVVSTFNLPESNPKRLSDKHYNHCCGSDIHQKQRGLNPDWIAANCYSVDIKQASELLGYPARSGGIILSGSNGQFQFRPDKPWSDKQGKKAAKYRTAFKDEYDALLPAHPSDPYFWHDLKALKARCWLIDGHPYIIITEGGFKAICACFHGLPTIALLGVEMGLTSAKSDPQGQRYLVSALERLAKAGFGFILAFDADISTKPNVREALHKLGVQLTKFNTPVQVLPSWDEQLGKGIDDYIQMNNIEKFRELLTKSISFETWVEQHQSSDEGPTPKLSALHRAWAKVLAEYGDRLRFNEMTRCIELDSEPATDLEGFYLDLALIHNCLITKTQAYDLAIRCAKQNPYHPVKDYLNHVADTVEPIDIRSLSHYYFGTTDPIYDEMMYRHLIGSVARIFKPGCKKDEAVILKGKQGVLKSTFWKVLYGEDFFSDSLKGTDRDDLLVLHQYWALELAEFETMTSKKQAGDLKAFLSASSDTFREPYARSSQARKRQSVIVGSVNPDAFLVDETGNRRYWVIPVSKKRIDLEKVARERDAIWAAAVLAYRDSEAWHLSYATEQKISELNQDYCHTDSWEVPLSNYLQGRPMVTIFELLTQALDFEASRIGKRDEMRVSSILRSLEWQKTLATYQGKRQKVWMKTDPPLCDPPHDPPSFLEVDQGENLDSTSNTAISDPPDPPINKSFSNSLKHPLRDEEVLINEQKFEPETLEVDQQNQTVTPQGVEPCDPPRSTPRSTSVVDQVDYSTYPHRTSNDIRAKEKRAFKCLVLMLGCTNKEELTRFKNESGFSSNEIDWVFHHVLTESEQQKLNEAALASQLNFLEPPSYDYNELIAAIDDELIRLGWTTEQAKEYLFQTYGVKARFKLSDEQIIELWQFLRQQSK
ncbi:hypothetical protein C7H19_23865 [Aphanothece hegewaldii CCALA 016]|uniref:Uncharacterized protein n=1 Tax=Aphanothece hegewaldii CCALA 016 TaxID=2107694 RepID=A0A2T1LQX5_9CHRO|nr:VapE domain-containing protein [Aphanothece hegewaldii]PSF30438.1 hypothetical protein C7H19_23865 [Aphanothece hegewaldii CCALA 016]